MPVSLERVQELTGKSVTFLEADLRFHSDDDCACWGDCVDDEYITLEPRMGEQHVKSVS